MNVIDKVRIAAMGIFFRMPERIPIAYTPPMEMGRYENGTKQFLGNILVGRERIFAVIHTFDSDGNYLKSDVWSSPSPPPDGTPAFQVAEEKFEEMLEKLRPLDYCSIAIKWFEVTLDGEQFGFQLGYTPGTIRLDPNDWVFYPPWHGQYDT
jgi:hypothetical protein